MPEELKLHDFSFLSEKKIKKIVLVVNLNFINHQKFLCKTLRGNSGTLRKIQKAGGLHFKNYAKTAGNANWSHGHNNESLKVCWLPIVTLNLHSVFCD